MARNYATDYAERRRKFLGRNASNINVAKDVSRQKYTKPELSQDTLTRMEIQKLIQDRISQGRSEEEITAELSSNPNYSKYSIYFKSWIDNQMTKVNKDLER